MPPPPPPTTTRLYRDMALTASVDIDKYVGGTVTVGAPTDVALLPITFDDAVIDTEDVDARMLQLGFAFESVRTEAASTQRCNYGTRAADPTEPAPAAGDYYYNSAFAENRIYNGAVWEAQAVDGDPQPPSGAASGDLLGTYPSPTVVVATTTLAGKVRLATQTEVDDAIDGPPGNTRPVVPTTLAAATTVVKPGDAAGGDLGGTYPNPTVTRGNKTIFFNADFGSDFGDYRTRSIATTAAFRFTFAVPSNFSSLVSLVLSCAPAGVGSAAGPYTLDSDYGAVGQQYNNHSETDAGETTADFSAAGEIMEIDISGVFSLLAANDYCGVLMSHETVGTTVNYFGVKMVYTPTSV